MDRTKDSTAEKIIIRKAIPGDAAEIAEMEELIFTDPWSFESVRHDIEENELAEYFVAAVEDESVPAKSAKPESLQDGKSGSAPSSETYRILGYVGIWWIREEGNICNVAVRPEARRQGIAKRLLEAVFSEGEGREPKAESYTLEVRYSNEPAIKLYKSLDFTIEGLRPNYYPDKEDALIMWRLEPSVYEETEKSRVEAAKIIAEIEKEFK